MTTPARFLTINETKQEYGFSHSTLYRFIAERKIEAVKIGRATRIVRDSVDRCVANLPRLQSAAGAPV